MNRGLSEAKIERIKKHLSDGEIENWGKGKREKGKGCMNGSPHQNRGKKPESPRSTLDVQYLGTLAYTRVYVSSIYQLNEYPHEFPN